MKILSTLAAASIAIGAVATTAEAEHVQRALILGGAEVPIGEKSYVAGLRITADGNTVCGGVLVSPIHVLTVPVCTEPGDIAYVAVGAHYINGTLTGEQIKVKSVEDHPQLGYTNFTYYFSLLTLDTPSNYAPINLPKADGSGIEPGMTTKAMGWGFTSSTENVNSNELRAVNLQLWSQADCGKHYNVSGSTTLCAGGVKGYDTCSVDTGGPLIKEDSDGVLGDTLVGLSSWGLGCGLDGVPSLYSRVSTAVEWINEVITPKK